jgi:hypothetical protein
MLSCKFTTCYGLIGPLSGSIHVGLKLTSNTVLNVLAFAVYNVTCLLKGRIVEPEKQPMLCIGCVTRNNGVTV